MRILIVEDEKPLSAAICRMLEQEHYSVDAAYTGTDGLDSALSGIYDAIILDVMLPGMDGFAILDALRRGGIDVPVLMLTARGSLDDRVRGLNMGADYYLPKPFERSELMACLNAITRRKSAPQVQELSFGDLTLDRETAPHRHTRAARNAPVSVPPSARRRRSAPVRGKAEYMLRITTAKGTDSSNCRCL